MSRGQLWQIEYFVVSHIPSGPSLQRELVARYNAQTLPVEERGTATYDRSFYRESSQMPRDYREGRTLGCFPSEDIIEYHTADLFITVRYEADNPEGEFTFWADGERIEP